jgi:hypothetical protein
MTLLQIALWVLSLQLADHGLRAELVEGRCSLCMQIGTTSRVELGIGSCTLMHCGSGYYDEKGVYVAPPKCNTCKVVHACSRGHNVVEEIQTQ